MSSSGERRVLGESDKTEENSQVANRLVVKDSEKNARIHGWRLSAKMALPSCARPISTQAPYPATVEMRRQ